MEHRSFNQVGAAQTARRLSGLTKMMRKKVYAYLRSHANILAIVFAILVLLVVVGWSYGEVRFSWTSTDVQVNFEAKR